MVNDYSRVETGVGSGDRGLEVRGLSVNRGIREVNLQCIREIQVEGWKGVVGPGEGPGGRYVHGFGGRVVGVQEGRE